MPLTAIFSSGVTSPISLQSKLDNRGFDVLYLTTSRIRCDVGKEWKSPEAFSKNKLHQFSNSMRRNKKVTAANSGIPCRMHSGEPETMLKCNGPCGKTYGLDNFSRNTRIRGVYVRPTSHHPEACSY